MNRINFIGLLLVASAACASAQKIDFYRDTKNGPYVSKTYDFTLAAANVTSGSLASSGANTITVKPCPLGVAGANANHQIYISGGVGTAETVTITGGTCTSGATSGTLQFTTANTHTGAWTIRSATAGLSEAYFVAAAAAGTGGTVRVHIPQGTHEFYGTFQGGDRRLYITGDGIGSTRINQNLRTAGVIRAINSTGLGYAFNLNGLSIFPVGGVMGSGIETIYVDDYPNGGVQEVEMDSPYVGIHWYNRSFGNPLLLTNIYIYGAQHIGLRMNSTGAGQTAGIIDNYYADGAGSTALEINGTVAGFTISNLWIQSVATCVYINGSTRNTNEILITNSILDGPTTVGLQVVGQSATDGTNNIRMTNTLIQHEGSSYGVIIQSTTRTYLADNTINSNSSNAAIVINGANRTSIKGNRLHSVSSTANGLIRVIAASDGMHIEGNDLYSAVALANGIEIAAVAVANAFINGNAIYPAANFPTPISNASTSGPVTIHSIAPACYSSASPAVCAASAAGAVTIAAGATTKVVNTTAVTANSQILLTFDSSLGTKLGVTCNTTLATPYVTARTPGTSFTITVGSAPAANPACYSYSILN